MAKNKKMQMCECGRHTYRPNGVCTECYNKMLTLIENFKKEFGVDLRALQTQGPYKEVYRAMDGTVIKVVDV